MPDSRKPTTTPPPPPLPRRGPVTVETDEEAAKAPAPRRAPRPGGPPRPSNGPSNGPRPGGGGYGGGRPSGPGNNNGGRPGGGFGGGRPGGPGNNGGRPGGFNNGRPGPGGRPGTQQGPRPTVVPRRIQTITLQPVMSVKELAEAMNVGGAVVVGELMKNGMMATINQQIDYETAAIIADGLGFTVEEAKPELDAAEEIIANQVKPADDPKAIWRPPVVTIMGHVDHGKTKLLDTIRSANVVAGEAGGITQHIGAYQVEIQGKKITFLDTPGHEAFTAMRARGAKATDIAILVVAADDGVMPQTIEALNHAKAANVPVIVAVNKIDKEDANPERVKQQLVEQGLVPAEWGGDTEFVEVSARSGLNVDKLLEVILVVSELLDLKANPAVPAVGPIIEAERDPRRGPVATVLIQNGTLNLRDYVVVGSTWGRIRAMNDDKARKLRKADPSTPAEIQGLEDVPMAGDVLLVLPDEKSAREVAEKRARQARMEALTQTSRPPTLEAMFSQLKEGKVKELRVIIKADVRGSLEAIRQSLLGLSTPEVNVRILHEGTGAITESDISLAVGDGAIVIGFNVRPDPPAKRASDATHVDVRFYNIIYNLIDDVKAGMAGLLDPTFRDVTSGYATVREVFRLPRNIQAAGLIVTDGKILRSDTVRVLRNGVVTNEGPIDALKRFKDDVREVAAGYECGLSLRDFNDFQVGDTLEFYHREQVS